MFNSKDDNKDNGGYPTSGPRYKSPTDRTIKPKDHFLGTNITGEENSKTIWIGNTSYKVPNDYQPAEVIKNDSGDDGFLVPIESHFVRDKNNKFNLKEASNPVKYKDGTPVFNGAMTDINPLDEDTKTLIKRDGLEEFDKKMVRLDKFNEEPKHDELIPPLSPLVPFFRMDDNSQPNMSPHRLARSSNLTSYNRTKLPIADLEFRKGFRHMFFSRPECYIMASDSGHSILSEQALYDEDFSSAYARMPHILQLLSPVYITGSFAHSSINSNWNYLLSNRAMGLSISNSTVSTNDNVTKSVTGYTVTPAMLMDSRQGATISISFRDTKSFEIYEMMRLWMLYMEKRKRGIFSPPYNGYAFRNEYPSLQSLNVAKGKQYQIIGHPYDRALEYCCSLFDVVTDETGSKILYWCKYYGLYPTDVSAPSVLSSTENAGALSGEAKVDVTFKYHYKLENVNKSLAEFNYNAGITDDFGRSLGKALKFSDPFLYREASEKEYKEDETINPDYVMENYVGAAGMFTGSPYIVLKYSDLNPLKVNGTNDPLVEPYLRFMPFDGADDSDTMNQRLNLNTIAHGDEKSPIVAIND